MTDLILDTERLRLVLDSAEATRDWIDELGPEIRAQLSAEWLALVEAADEADPWVHGFRMVQRDSDTVIGSCGFKGPPSAEGAVEIAYQVEPDWQGQGYATESARALAAYAAGQGGVRVVRAHTLPEENASTRVLTKCGFECVGEVIDPDDGPVWRWERRGGR